MTMDKWAPEHIAQMMAGGNAAFVSYVREVDRTLLDEKFLKYNLQKILYYRSGQRDLLLVRICSSNS